MKGQDIESKSADLVPTSLDSKVSTIHPSDNTSSSQSSISTPNTLTSTTENRNLTGDILNTDIVPRNRVSRSGNGFEYKDTYLAYLYEDDRKGLIEVKVGDVFLNRYEVIGLAGQGTFGTVLDVYDRVLKRRLALKVLRAVKRYIDAAQVEIDIIERLQKFDVHNESLCVRLYNHFPLIWNGQEHICLGFEKLGRSLYEFISKNGYAGFRLCDVRHFAFQLLLALAFCHKAGLIHTDLKPENILLCHSDSYESAIGDPSHVRSLGPPSDKREKYRIPVIAKTKLIDFGGSILPEHGHSSVINTRQYRSPEVLLNLGWSYPSDIWSAGCILAELFSGDLLFSTHDDLEHLALLERVLEKPLPISLTRSAYTKSGVPTLDRTDDTDVYSRPKHRRDNSHSSRYTTDRDRDYQKRIYPKRDWNEKRERSRSVLNVRQLIRSDTFELRWPENAVDLQSVRNVRRSRTLKSVIFSGCKEYDKIQVSASALEASEKERRSIIDSIKASGDVILGNQNSNTQFTNVSHNIEESIILDTADTVENAYPTLGELIEFHDLLSQLLRYDPEKRLTAREALFHPFFDTIRDMYKPPAFLADPSPLLEHPKKT